MKRLSDLIPNEEWHRQVWPIPTPKEPSIIVQSSGTTQSYAEETLHRIDLVQRVASLENKMRRFESLFSVSTVPINTLGNSKWELRQLLSVSIEQRGAEDFVACLYDVDLYGYGDTVPEALNDLKTAIVNQFEYLIRQDKEIQLGEPLKRQLQFLRNILVKTDA